MSIGISRQVRQPREERETASASAGHRVPVNIGLARGMFFASLICGMLPASAARAATTAQVDEGIKKATAFLYSKEANGNWEAGPEPDPNAGIPDPNGGQFGGQTAIAVYALLCADENPSDPRIVSAINFLVSHPPHGVYAAAARCLVWSRVEMKPKLRVAAQKDVAFLLKATKVQGEARGLFYYDLPTSEVDVRYDHSVSQFALLGLSVLNHLGFEIPGAFWQGTQDAWQDHQYDDGGWSYVFNGDGQTGKRTASMTAAGVATLFLTQSALRLRTDCRGNTPTPNIDKGISWLASHFDLAFDPNAELNNLHFETYALFAISRVGVASGYRHFGDIDWYQRGADYLLGSQLPDGSWSGDIPVVANTSLAMLFFIYGRAPILLGKLEYTLAPLNGKPPAANWDQRPEDLLNFADWMGRRLEQRVNWQVVDLNGSAEQMHESPVLCISGDQELVFDEPQKATLREFVARGGMILGNADCDSAAFTKNFIKLGTQLFPSYEFRELPANHPIYTNEQYKIKKRLRVQGLSNGVRELLLLPGYDLSRTFEGRNEGTRVDLYQLAANITLYAVDTQLTPKEPRRIVIEDANVPIERSVKVARIQYAGNWDPEPGGWQRLKAVLHNSWKIGMDVQTVKLGDPIPADCKIATLTGTTQLTLTGAQRKSLLDFVNSGGTLALDAAGGSAEFAASAEAELKTMFGSDANATPAVPLPASSPVYNLPGMQIDAVSYRSFTRAKLTGTIKTPRLRGVEQKGRIVAFYSREDLSHGLLGVPVDGLLGYSPESATAIMRNVIVYAAFGGH